MRYSTAQPVQTILRSASLHTRTLAVLITLWLNLLLPTNIVSADDLEVVRQRGTLRWGGDQEGGAPFIFPDPQNPRELIGFEVELMQLVADQLGVKAEFRQGQWDKLPSLLGRGDIDVVMNGYEWTPLLAAEFGTSIPYYIYELVLIARRNDTELQDWEDLKRPEFRDRKNVVSVLTGSAADDYGQTFSDTVTLRGYDGVTDALRAVEQGQDGVRANIQDRPIWITYADRYQKLHQIGRPLAPGFYVALTRTEDLKLRQAINEAILLLMRNGTLRRLCEKYGLWNETQSLRSIELDEADKFFAPISASSAEAPVRPQIGTSLWPSRKALLVASTWTILLSLCAMPLAIAAGLGLALLRLYGPAPLSLLSRLFVEMIRGTPLALQLILIYFVLPEFLEWLPGDTQWSLSSFPSAVLALALNYSACEAEIYRAGLQNLPKGQMEAALSLGMTPAQAIRRILIPQATRHVIPPVTNDFIAMFKDTAVCSVIGIAELSKAYYIEAQNTSAVIELGATTALIYLAMSYPLSVLSGRLEDQQHRGKSN
jgi:polar amino acid transport system substrate-binding protein